MSLTVWVGIGEDDLKSLGDRYAADFKCVNRLLKAAGLKAHREPLPAPKTWAMSLGGYANLHHLRRFAAALAVNGSPLPPLASSARASQAPELATYQTGRANGTLPASCDHLLFHSDAEGYYVPVAFAEVLNGNRVQPLTGDWLGSSVRLGEECAALAAVLELPPDLDFDFDDDDEWARLKKETQGAVWHAYPTEAFVCAVLLRASAVSVQRRSAMVFG